MERKAQAAMEFLMTYGWAILAAVIVIGVLAYFGVFSPSTYVPNQCVVSAPFGCNAGVINQYTTLGYANVTLEVRNGGGEPLNATNIYISAPCNASLFVGMIAADELKTANLNCTSNMTVGSKFKGDITITYRKASSNLDLSSSGTIVSKVTAVA
jgi:hypothetical protein